MKKIHFKNIPPADFLTEEEMKGLVGGLYAADGGNNCNTSCTGGCTAVENNTSYPGTCIRSKVSGNCNCNYVVPGPLTSTSPTSGEK